MLRRSANDEEAAAAASAGTRSASAPGGLRTEVRGAPASETISVTGETLADSSTTCGSVQTGASPSPSAPSYADTGLAEPGGAGGYASLAAGDRSRVATEDLA
ncbi:MAG: hypothetical protein IJ131_02915 [Eggerthellaceae bacterium]|nr:hypothetical protein [Eggerthellaceae bacterium]